MMLREDTWNLVTQLDPACSLVNSDCLRNLSIRHYVEENGINNLLSEKT